MQAAAIAAAKGSIAAPDLRSRTRVSASFGQFKNGGFVRNNLLMPHTVFCCGSSPLRLVDMGVGIAQVRNGVETIFRSKGKARSVRAQSAAGDIEDVPSDKHKAKSSGTVLPFVGVACLGAILFGYHLGVVNGALEYLARDLGITENTVLQGWVASTLLAGATVGSFTGGALADKFGRTRTF